MVDKATFKRINPNWDNLSLPKGAGNEYDNVSGVLIPSGRGLRHGQDEYYSNNREEDTEKVKEERAQQRLNAQKNELSEEDFLLATPIVYGFALGDKEWGEWPYIWLKSRSDQGFDFYSGNGYRQSKRL